jgi:hypothetical protein
MKKVTQGIIAFHLIKGGDGVVVGGKADVLVWGIGSFVADALRC